MQSAAELLGCLPDIACFGKLMTGGIIPLAATLATETVFNAFRGDSKVIRSYGTCDEILMFQNLLYLKS